MIIISKIDKSKKTRIFNLLLYPDNEMHKEAIDRLKSDEFNAVGILHNCDIYEDGERIGEIKKEHYHFVVKFPNPRYCSGLAIELCIDERFIEPCGSFKGSTKYLLHYGDPDKYQYEPSDLVGILKKDILNLINDTSEDSKVFEIRKYIKSFDGYISRSVVFDYCLENGLYSAYRRSYTIFSDLIGEHNQRIYESKHFN